VMLGAAITAMLAALGLMLMPSADKLSLVLVGALFGAGAFPLYALAVAHANDCADASQSVEVSSGLLLLYGMGAAVGPLIAAVWRDVFSAPSLFYFTAAVHVVLASYVVWRMSRRQAPDADQRVQFTEAAIVAQTVLPIEPQAVSAGAGDGDADTGTPQRN